MNTTKKTTEKSIEAAKNTGEKAAESTISKAPALKIRTHIKAGGVDKR